MRKSGKHLNTGSELIKPFNWHGNKKFVYISFKNGFFFTCNKKKNISFYTLVLKINS